VATSDDDVSVKQQIALNLGLIYKALLAESALNLVPVPATATSNGTAGQVAADASFLYVCIATNVWRRVAVAAF
jgi:hypothetical protein